MSDISIQQAVRVSAKVNKDDISKPGDKLEIDKNSLAIAKITEI